MTSFLGRVPASKSLLNRWLVIRSFEPSLQVTGDSECDDVVKMKSALAALMSGARDAIDCGSGGTVLRFMAFRASRVPGRHVLTGHRRLFERPQDELVRVLGQLGVQVEINQESLIIDGDGWRPQGDTILVPANRSSQFLTGLLINAWDLPFDLFVSPIGLGLSQGYWSMSQKVAELAGLRLERWDQDFCVRSGQRVTLGEVSIEPDMSSAFGLAAVAAVDGQVTLLDFPQKSLQPDAVFVDLFEKMGIPVQRSGDRLKVSKAEHLHSIAFNLRSCPDLFPILAALCALADGESELYGAPQLVFKESDRIAKTEELIQKIGRRTERKPDGLRIYGERRPPGDAWVFDPDFDHRLAMAAAVLVKAGYPIEISHPEVVDKSFPEFWRAIGWSDMTDKL